VSIAVSHSLGKAMTKAYSSPATKDSPDAAVCENRSRPDLAEMQKAARSLREAGGLTFETMRVAERP
jgi:hypothetical protein